MSEKETIFVSIACYMDKDIINTINDCLSKAKYPKRVIFGICLQFDPEDKFFEKYENNPQIRIKRMHWKEAKGPMYARYFCTKLVKNEDYFLQIDCHTRFYKDWDKIIIEELHKCEKLHDKCVISHYPLNISRMHLPDWQKKIGMIKTFRYVNVDSIKSHGSLQKLPSEPVQSYGIMAAMKFMRVKSLLEVPYDINTYHGYHGEEQFYYSVRLWSRGFNCYTPTKHILAMEYGTNRDRLTRESKSHLATDSALWNQRTWRKCKYYMRLDTLESINYDGYINDVLENQKIYGLGDERNVIDYFKMTGLHDKLLNLFPFYKSYVNHKFHNDDFTHLLEISNPGKKIAVVTQNTPNLIRHYYKEARENHLMYCRRHGYTYYVFYDNLAEEVNRGESPKISWSKVKATLNVVENHDYTMWMDADAVFTNQNIRIEDMIDKHPNKDYYLCRDPKTHFVNSGVSIWKNSKDSLFMLNKWWDGEHIPYGKGGDQKPLGDFLKVNRNYDKYWHHFSEREMNCYPSNYYPDDYIIHFMGVKSKIDIKNRLKIWNNYIKKENEDLKMYISLTTTKEKIEILPYYVKNLLKNTVKPNKIVITVTADCDIKRINELLKEHIDKKIVFIHIEKDNYGSLLGYIGINNFIKTNDLISKENFGVIVLSDKLFYKNYIVEQYKKNSILHPRTILTLYHMSAMKINIANGLGGSFVLKDADSIFLPKYFFVQNTNPSLQETVSEITKKYSYTDFSHQDIFTVFCYYKNMEKKSINKDRRTCYNHINPSDINNITIDVVNKKYPNKSKEIINNFEQYYLHGKYSNVKFIHHIEVYNNLSITCQKATINYMWNFKPNERKPFPNHVLIHNKQFYDDAKIINPKDIEELLDLNDFEDLKELYNLLPNWVSKADLGRLLYIYYHGGIYIDADCFMHRQIDLNSNNALVFVEKKVKSLDMVSSDESKSNPDNVVRMANFCFGSIIKKHPLFKEAVLECLRRIKFRYVEKGNNHLTNNNYDEKTLRQKEILWVCGPDVITCVYHKVKQNCDDILSLSSDYLQHNIAHSWW